MPQPGFLLRFNLYRIFKEVLGNIVKHAHAKNVWVTVLLSSEAIEMKIRDDGVGFIPQEVTREGRYGMRNMEKRVKELGGTIDFCSEPGRGTTIHLKLPLGDIKIEKITQLGYRQGYF